MTDFMRVELAYANQTQQYLSSFSVKSASTVNELITLSRIMQDYPEINFPYFGVGIFSVACDLDAVLKDGDRVEIYPPLFQDPMTARRIRIKNSTVKSGK